MAARREIRRGRSGQHRVVLVGSNGEVVAVSAAYRARRDAEAIAPSVAVWSAYPPALEDVVLAPQPGPAAARA
jgi:uncharacterized protein YegP (UPF0339 family)